MLTAFAQHRLQASKEKREKHFQERKEAYLGLLRSLHDAAVRPSNEASKEFAYWQLRCELVAPGGVCMAIQRIVDTNDDRVQRDIAYKDLKEKLRADLGLVR